MQLPDRSIIYPSAVQHGAFRQVALASAAVVRRAGTRSLAEENKEFTHFSRWCAAPSEGYSSAIVG
jgi:hypothetical protein